MSTYCGHYPDRDHVDCPSSVECHHAGTVVPTLRIIRVQFTEDQIHDGTLPYECYENAREEVWHPGDDDPAETVDDAVRIIRREGLSFAATGAAWAADPDGSRTIDYGTGMREEVSAHLDGFTSAQTAEIIARVG